MINGLTTHLTEWEDNGWIGIKNAPLFKKAAYLLKRRSAPTLFKWVKGHSGDEGNEGSDQLAKEGAEKANPDELNLKIPKEFNLQGAKLATLSQAIAYKGILEQRGPYTQLETSNNLESAQIAIAEYTQTLETDETIWRGLQKPTIRIKIRQFLYKAMYETQKIGHFWSHIPGYKERQNCPTCQVPESMTHILIHCRATPVRAIWHLAREHWPHENPRWSNITLRMILGCSSIIRISHPEPNNAENHEHRSDTGAVRLLQILLTELAHLIWVLRCERVIQQKDHSTNEIKTRWVANINKRLTEDKIITTKVKRDKTSIRKVRSTWEALLKKTWELPYNWLQNREFLVGRRERGPSPSRTLTLSPTLPQYQGCVSICISSHPGSPPGSNALGEADGKSPNTEHSCVVRACI